MAHSGSLRVIGQSLEIAKLHRFTLETDGQDYLLRSDSLTAASEWILHHALAPNDLSGLGVRQSKGSQVVRFTPADILRLGDQAQRQRRPNSSAHAETYRRLSQLLRTLGDHLDRTEVSYFHISWARSFSCR